MHISRLTADDQKGKKEYYRKKMLTANWRIERSEFRVMCDQPTPCTAPGIFFIKRKVFLRLFDYIFAAPPRTDFTSSLRHKGLFLLQPL